MRVLRGLDVIGSYFLACSLSSSRSWRIHLAHSGSFLFLSCSREQWFYIIYLPRHAWKIKLTSTQNDKGQFVLLWIIKYMWVGIYMVICLHMNENGWCRHVPVYVCCVCSFFFFLLYLDLSNANFFLFSTVDICSCWKRRPRMDPGHFTHSQERSYWTTTQHSCGAMVSFIWWCRWQGWRCW